MGKMRGLGYLGLNVADLGAWRKFACELLGLMPVEDARSDAQLFRMDERAWRIALHPERPEGLAYAGWECADPAEFEAAVARIEARGTHVERPDPSRRGVSGLARFRDPAGQTHELFWGAAVENDVPFVSPAGVSGFTTAGIGMGHVLLSVSSARECFAFFSELGFRLTDRTSMGGDKQALFLRASRRHHSLALADAFPMPGMHHFMLEVQRLEDLGRAYERAQELGVPITMNLGQHVNDRMLSFYVRTPSGFELEYGWNGILVDDATWTVTEFSGRGDLWGHRGSTMDAITAGREQQDRAAGRGGR
jgi:2,3-dihydroxybiphenyl 1,2-dioxygenase